MLMCLLQSGALQVDSSPCFRKAQNDKKETLVIKGFFCSERQLSVFKSRLSKSALHFCGYFAALSMTRIISMTRQVKFICILTFKALALNVKC